MSSTQGGVPDLGPIPIRTAVTVDQVRVLIDAQFPQWRGLPIAPVAKGGWDNLTFHLGDDLLVRLPSAAPYAEAVEKEQRWLPILASQLPLPIPVPEGLGEPTKTYPYPWSVYRWMPGSAATRERITDPVRVAEDLAEFLGALQRIDPSGGPQPGIHNWYRGGTLRTFDQTVQNALRELTDQIDVGLATRIWAEALGAPWDGIDRWFHGDVARGNLLLDEAGELAAVIDFGTCGVGDPACDLAIAWTLLAEPAREVFRRQLDVDDATWARGRGWALWKSLATYASTYDDPNEVDEFEPAQRAVDEVLGSGRGRN